MKKPDDDKLFRLVKAMSEEETAFFRKHFLNESAGKDSASARLFELLRTEASYLESDILKTLTIKSESLPVIKSNLYSEILDSLRISAAASRPERELSIMIELAEILISKGLFKEAQQLIAKAEEQAVNQSTYYHYGIIKSWQVTLLQYFTDDAFHENAARLFDEIIQNGNDILMSQRIYGMYLLSTTLVTKGNFGRNPDDLRQLEQITDNEYFRSDRLDYRHKTKVHLLATKIHYYAHKGELEQSFDYSLILWKEIIKRQKETGKENGTELLTAGMELMSAACNVKKFDAARQALRQFRETYERNYPDNNYYEAICLYFSCQINDMDSGLKIGSEEFRRLFDFCSSTKFSQVPPQVARAMNFLLADIFFSNGEYEETLVYTGKLSLEKSTSQTRLDQLTCGRILHLMAMFETTYESKGRVFKSRDTLMHVRAKQFYETVRKLEDNYQYERLVFRFFMHLPERTEAKELAALFEKLKGDIDRLKAKPGNEYIKPLTIMLDFQKWISGKVSAFQEISLKF